MSLAIIFFPKTLRQLVPIMAFIVAHQGLLSGMYVMMLFQKLLFPVVSEENENDGLKRSPYERPAYLDFLFPPDDDEDEDTNRPSSTHGDSNRSSNAGEDGDSAANDEALWLGDGDVEMVVDLQNDQNDINNNVNNNNNSNNNYINSSPIRDYVRKQDTRLSRKTSFRDRSTSSGSNQPYSPVQGSLWIQSNSLDTSTWSAAANNNNNNNNNNPNSPLSSPRSIRVSGEATPLSNPMRTERSAGQIESFSI